MHIEKPSYTTFLYLLLIDAISSISSIHLFYVLFICFLSIFVSYGKIERKLEISWNQKDKIKCNTEKLYSSLG